MWPFTKRSKHEPDERLDDDEVEWSIENTMRYGYELDDRAHVTKEALRALERGSQSQLAPTFDRPAG